MEWATAIVGMALGALLGWSLAGWLEGREQRQIRDVYDGLDELRRHRNGGGL
jgi:membrane protein YqaA with SNARE-associated domain